MRRLRLYLSREANGQYMLTRLEPIRAPIAGTQEETLWVQPGDPVGFRGVCPWFAAALWGVELEPLQSVRVEMRGGGGT